MSGSLFDGCEFPIAEANGSAGTRAGRLALGCAAVVAVLGLAGLSMVVGGARVDAAARRVSAMAAGYQRLGEGELERAVFPIAETLAGTELTGAPVACGIVLTGIELQGGVPVVAWQRAHGTCAGTRLRRPGGAAALPQGVVASGPMVAVEMLTARPRMGMQERGYAVAFASPPAGALPVVSQR